MPFNTSDFILLSQILVKLNNSLLSENQYDDLELLILQQDSRLTRTSRNVQFGSLPANLRPPAGLAADMPAPIGRLPDPGQEPGPIPIVSPPPPPSLPQLSSEPSSSLLASPQGSQPQLYQTGTYSASQPSYGTYASVSSLPQQQQTYQTANPLSATEIAAIPILLEKLRSIMELVLVAKQQQQGLIQFQRQGQGQAQAQTQQNGYAQPQQGYSLAAAPQPLQEAYPTASRQQQASYPIPIQSPQLSNYNSYAQPIPPQPTFAMSPSNEQVRFCFLQNLKMN